MHIKRAVLTLVTVFLFLILASASIQAQTTDTSDLLAQLEQIITEEMPIYQVPGAAVAVISGDEVIYTQGFGVRDVETGDPFTTDTRFRIGSTTKSMTSLLIAQLVDEGLLTWDTPITDILPDFETIDPALTERIAVRDLMSMATGLISQDLTMFDWGTWDIQDLFDAISTMTIDGEFRNSHFYNNEVYALAGYVAAVASGLEPTLESYTMLMQERIFDPIGMDNAIIIDDLSALGDNYAHAYEPALLGEADELSRMIDPPIGLIAPAGAVWASVDDMAQYVITQMNGGVTPDGTRIVSEENLAETWEPVAPVAADLVGFEDVMYAMGWVTQTYRGVPMRWHSGGWVGYNTRMTIFPESDTAIIVFSNAVFGTPFNDTVTYAFSELWHELDAEVVSAARGDMEAIAEQLDQVRMFASDSAIDPQIVEPFVGAYQGGWNLENRDDGSLWLTHGVWEFQLIYIAPVEKYLIINNGVLGAWVSFDADTDPITMNIEVTGTDVYSLVKVE